MRSGVLLLAAEVAGSSSSRVVQTLQLRPGDAGFVAAVTFVDAVETDMARFWRLRNVAGAVGNDPLG